MQWSPVEHLEVELRMTGSPRPGRQLQQLRPPPSWKRTVRSGQLGCSESLAGQVTTMVAGYIRPSRMILLGRQQGWGGSGAGGTQIVMDGVEGEREALVDRAGCVAVRKCTRWSY